MIEVCTRGTGRDAAVALSAPNSTQRMLISQSMPSCSARLHALAARSEVDRSSRKDVGGSSKVACCRYTRAPSRVLGVSEDVEVDASHVIESSVDAKMLFGHARMRSSRCQGQSTHAHGSAVHALGSALHAQGSAVHAHGSLVHAQWRIVHAQGRPMRPRRGRLIACAGEPCTRPRERSARCMDVALAKRRADTLLLARRLLSREP